MLWGRPGFYAHSNYSSILSKGLTNVPGNIKITVEYSVHDSVYVKDQRFKSRADKDHPIFSLLGVPPFVKYKLYVAGDKFTTDYSLKIDKDDIPFYPVDLHFELEYYELREYSLTNKKSRHLRAGFREK
jgi:hypothetical protein